MIKATKALAKRRTLFAGVLALTIFGAVYGFAATLGVASTTLSAGNATVASCQRPARRPAPTRRRTTRRSPATRCAASPSRALDAACATKSISVTLTGASRNEPSAPR